MTSADAGVIGFPARRQAVEHLNPWWLTLAVPLIAVCGAVLQKLLDRWQKRDELTVSREATAADLTLAREAKASEVSLSRDSLAFQVLQSEMTRMAGRLETLETRIAHLERELDASHLKITELQGEVYRLTSERDGLTRENARYTIQVREQAARIIDLEAKIALEKAQALGVAETLGRLREVQSGHRDDRVLGHQPREIDEPE